MKRFASILASVVLTVSAAFAGMSGGSVDPFYLLNIGANQDTNPVSLRSAQTLDSGVRNLVIIVPGQSDIGNVAPSAYVPANPSKIDNFNIADGATYSAADPLLGSTQTNGPGHPVLRLADNLITANKFDRVVIAPIAVQGTTVADWQTGFVSTRLQVVFGRLAARGMVAGTNVTVIVLWGQGEADNGAGTTQTAYTNSLNAVIAASRTAGFAGKWFVAKETWTGVVSVPVQNAQAAVVDHGASVWAGPDADSLINNTCSGAACRIADNIHWTDAGSASYAAGWNTALTASGAPF